MSEKATRFFFFFFFVVVVVSRQVLMISFVGCLTSIVGIITFVIES